MLYLLIPSTSEVLLEGKQHLLSLIKADIDMDSVKEKENLCKVDYKNSESKAVLTCLFNEDLANTRRNFTVYKHNGQDKESTILFCSFIQNYDNFSKMCVFTDKCLPTCKLKYIFVLSLKQRNGEKKEEKKGKR